MEQKEILSSWSDDMQTIKGYADNEIGYYNTIMYVADSAIKAIKNGSAVDIDSYIKRYINRVKVVVSNIIRRHNNSGCYHITMSATDKYICAYNLLYDAITDSI